MIPDLDLISVTRPDTTINDDFVSINRIVLKPLVIHSWMVSIYNQVAFKLLKILFETLDSMTSIKSINIILTRRLNSAFLETVHYVHVSFDICYSSV